MTAPARPYDKKHKNERQRKATHHRIGCSCRKIGQGYGIADDQDNGANACQARTASPRASEISEYETAKCKNDHKHPTGKISNTEQPFHRSDAVKRQRHVE
jgi:hypothetical protein